jgi:hypothetical protein
MVTIPDGNRTNEHELNPSDATFDSVEPQLAEAYELAGKRRTKSSCGGQP